mmetsp:Transcript_94140/g.177006  ORF Transcript_94140/g.177006 Transcript_94140/m.177006 type:complete len:270 (-) Transcript_94140:83-892(-)
MHRIALVLTCLACVGARQLAQSYPVSEIHESFNPSKDLASLLLALNPEASFNPSGPGLQASMDRPAFANRRPMVHMNDRITRSQLLKAASAVALAAPALPALATSGLSETAIRQSYEQYVPVIELGRDYWGLQLQGNIQKRDWAAIQTALRAPSKKRKIPPGVVYKTPLNMRLWAGSFSGQNYISQQTNAMNAAVDDLDEAIASLDTAAEGKAKDNGLFGFITGPKQLSDEDRTKLALLAYKKGKTAINNYIKIANSDIVFVDPLDLMD